MITRTTSQAASDGPRDGLITMSAVILYIGGTVALAQMDFDANSEPWPLISVVTIGIVSGILIGRWSALSLALILPLESLLWPDEGGLGTTILTLVGTAPIAVVALSVGVWLRRFGTVE